MNSDFIPGSVVSIPTNTVAPVLSPTTNIAMSTTLSVTTGSWTSTPSSYRYQWMRDGVDIAGATANTYVPVVADHGTVITAKVWATNSAGESATFATSNATSTLDLIVGTPGVVSFSNSAAAATLTTTSFTPPYASSPLFAWVITRRDSGGAANVATFTDTEGGSLANGAWVSLANTELTVTGSLRAQLLVKTSNATPVSMTCTAASASATSMAIAIIHCRNGSTDYSNIKTGTNTAGDPSTTLDTAPASLSTCISWLACYGANSSGTPPNYTQILSTLLAGSLRWAAAYDAADAGTAAWTTANTNAINTLLEIKPR